MPRSEPDRSGPSRADAIKLFLDFGRFTNHPVDRVTYEVVE